MENFNELLALRNKIENTLNYQLSLSNLELYHSNLFAVVLEKSGFINHHFFSNIIDINKKYTDLKVYREKNSIDLTIEVTDEDGQTHVIFIENKVKSLPDKSQLIRYSEKDSNAKGILLSLVNPGFDLPGSWFRKSYGELIYYYRDLLDKVEDKSCYHIGNKDNQTPLEHDIPTLVHIQKEVRERIILGIWNIEF